MNVAEITLTGTPYEKGLRHGRECKKQVLRSLETYSNRYLNQRGLTWEDAKRLSRRFLGVFTGEFEKYLEEMRGIADGSGLELLDVLAINLRSEILYSGLKDMRLEADECTCFAALPPATEGDKVLAGQTWDYTLAQREASFIARIPEEDGHAALLMLLEGGMVGGKGVSKEGLCLCLNALTGKTAAIGLPLHVRMRACLEQNTLNDAMKMCLLSPIPVPVNLVITHKDGLCFSIEMDPEGAQILEPENGVLAHTNHYKGSKMLLRHDNSALGSTYIRNQRMTNLLKSKEKLTMENLEGFCRDHAGYPTSICAHPAANTPKDRLEYAGSTNYAFIADLSSMRVRFVMGNPCQGEFEDIKL